MHTNTVHPGRTPVLFVVVNSVYYCVEPLECHGADQFEGIANLDLSRFLDRGFSAVVLLSTLGNFSVSHDIVFQTQ